MVSTTCNETFDEMRIGTSEIPIAGYFTFHDLALTIAGGSTIVAILLSVYLMFMHAIHYTRPSEQKHIIRILFMVPVYATASWLQIKYYWHAIYFEVVSDCYEAFAISSFFALLCHYVAPDLHEQKDYFRQLRPIEPWVWPINWFAKCCGGRRGPWRTPQSGLTWFNIVWIGIYHYCFIRVAATITAVVTQYFGKYCESSNSPVFSHIWILIIESIAVTVAMYCVIQFYVQLKKPLAGHRPFLKVLAIKLVIFLSFWQSTAISLGTSTLDFLQPNAVLAYPDIKVGIPCLLLCFEMACFALLHIWAFSYKPYLDNAKPVFYPDPDPDAPSTPRRIAQGERQGGPMGLKAFWDAANLWDVIKAFGRGMRWLFVGVKHRKRDVSYRTTRKNSSVTESGLDMDDFGAGKEGGADTRYLGAAGLRAHQLGGMGKSTDHLPIATEFRRSQYGPTKGSPLSQQVNNDPYGRDPRMGNEERKGLIAHAQDNPHSPGMAPAAMGGSAVAGPSAPLFVGRRREDSNPYSDGSGSNPRDDEYDMMHDAEPVANMPMPRAPYHGWNDGNTRTHSLSTVEEESLRGSHGNMYSMPGAAVSTTGSIPIVMTNSVAMDAYGVPEQHQQQQHYHHQLYSQQQAQQPQRGNPRNSTQAKFGQALWGAQGQAPPRPYDPNSRGGGPGGNMI